MLEFIKGNILQISEFEMIVEVGSIGFKILTPSDFKEGSKDVLIYLIHQIKENEIILYGFKTLKERDIFLKLTNINGVGVKQALKILKTFSVEEIEKSVKERNIKTFQQVSGIGRKLAQRIVLELADSLDFTDDSKEDEVIEALMEFGYKKEVVKDVLKEIPKNLNVEEKLREALKILSKKKFLK